MALPPQSLSGAVALALALGGGGAVGGCKGESDDKIGPPPAAGADRARVAAALGACTFEVIKMFLPAAEELAAACSALKEAASAERTAAARSAWVKAIGAWQEAEVFQYGPAAAAKPSPSGVGGKGLRDEIYSWPFTGRCLIEQQIVSEAYKSADFPKSVINGRGLAALELLLFYEGRDNACAATAAINSSGAWAALTPEELDRRRREYAATAAADVARRARELVDAWDPAKGGFLRETMTAGAGSAVYKTAQALLNAQSDALFYLEVPVKDVKLARPLGLKDCTSAPCLDALESRYAQRSKDHIKRNLDGFEKLAFGCPGADAAGFDDLMGAVGAAGFGDRLRARIADARNALDAIGGEDFRESLMTDAGPTRKVHEAIKAITDGLLKAEMTTALDLKKPMSLESDTD